MACQMLAEGMILECKIGYWCEMIYICDREKIYDKGAKLYFMIDTKHTYKEVNHRNCNAAKS